MTRRTFARVLAALGALGLPSAGGAQPDTTLRVRAFHRISDGRRLAPILTSQGPWSVSAAAHLDNMRAAYPSIAPEDLALDDLADLPDLTGALPVEAPAIPLATDQEDDSARAMKLPTFAQIDAAVDSALTAAQGGNWTPLGTLLKRLAKIERVLARHSGLGD